MAVIKVKPTSPGRRAVVKVVHSHLHKGKPEASLLEPQFQHAGRNNNGHITIRHKGGGTSTTTVLSISCEIKMEFQRRLSVLSTTQIAPLTLPWSVMRTANVAM